MQNTTNYNLNKPDGNDFAKIQSLNENADIIDGKLKELEDNTGTVDGRITTHLAENAVGAHKAKNIALEDVDGLFVGTELETAMKELFTSVSNGKQLIGTAITDVDDSLIVPTNPTFQVLADLIRAIETGYKHATGTSWTSFTGDPNSQRYTQLIIDGLDFVPKLLIATRYYDSGSARWGKSIIYSTGEILTNYNLLVYSTSGNVGNVLTDKIEPIDGGIKVVSSDQALRDSISAGSPQVSYEWIALG